MFSQPAAQVLNLVRLRPAAAEAQPGLLHGVVGLGQRAQQAVGDGPQARSLLRARKVRHEESYGVHLPDPVLSRDGGELQPEEEVLLADSVGLALLVVLDSLAPAERLAFVLHDVFQLPFEEIAPVVGRTPVAARQLASRARRLEIDAIADARRIQRIAAPVLGGSSAGR
jgi:hypothetical protein